MHTSGLRLESFAVEVNGTTASFEQVFPSWGNDDRVGVVMFSDLAATGVSLLIQLAIARFYEIRRENGLFDSLQRTVPGFIMYPDNYSFHVGGRHGDFSAMDFFPSHKEVFVGDEGNDLLNAINDRAITRLLIEEREPSNSVIEPSALVSATERLRSILVYSRTGRVADADVYLRATDDSVEGNVKGVLDVDSLLDEYAGSTDPRVLDAMRMIAERRTEVATHVRSAVAEQRSAILEDGRAIESYRRVCLEEALRLLAPSRSNRQPAAIS